MEKRQLLVYFETRSGEYESNDHTVIQMKNGESAEETIHNYFMEYYPHEKAGEIKRAEYYLWMTVAVSIRSWRVLTKEQYKTLKELSLLWQ